MVDNVGQKVYRDVDKAMKYTAVDESAKRRRAQAPPPETRFFSDKDKNANVIDQFTGEKPGTVKYEHPSKITAKITKLRTALKNARMAASKASDNLQLNKNPEKKGALEAALVKADGYAAKLELQLSKERSNFAAVMSTPVQASELSLGRKSAKKTPKTPVTVPAPTVAKAQVPAEVFNPMAAIRESKIITALEVKDGEAELFGNSNVQNPSVPAELQATPTETDIRFAESFFTDAPGLKPLVKESEPVVHSSKVVAKVAPKNEPKARIGATDAELFADMKAEYDAGRTKPSAPVPAPVKAEPEETIDPQIVLLKARQKARVSKMKEAKAAIKAVPASTTELAYKQAQVDLAKMKKEVRALQNARRPDEKQIQNLNSAILAKMVDMVNLKEKNAELQELEMAASEVYSRSIPGNGPRYIVSYAGQKQPKATSTPAPATITKIAQATPTPAVVTPAPATVIASIPAEEKATPEIKKAGRPPKAEPQPQVIRLADTVITASAPKNKDEVTFGSAELVSLKQAEKQADQVMDFTNEPDSALLDFTSEVNEPDYSLLNFYRADLKDVANSSSYGNVFKVNLDDLGIDNAGKIVNNMIPDDDLKKAFNDYQQELSYIEKQNEQSIAW